MSRILKNKKLLVLSSGFLLAIALLFTSLWILSILILGGVLFVLMNHIVIREIGRPFQALSSVREIKSYDTLVIGEYAALSEYGAYCNKDRSVVITSPNRSLEASYQLLLHTISCIEDDGTCIILYNRKALLKGFTLFDIPYIHPITRKELQIEHLVKQNRLPLLYEPIKSLKMLLRIKKRGFFETECPSAEIKNYCDKKGIHLIYLTKQ